MKGDKLDFEVSEASRWCSNIVKLVERRDESTQSPTENHLQPLWGINTGALSREQCKCTWTVLLSLQSAQPRSKKPESGLTGQTLGTTTPLSALFMMPFLPLHLHSVRNS